MALASRIKEHWREQQLFNSRILVTVFILLTLIALVIIRLTQLQVLKYDYYSAQSSGNQIRAEPIPPIRGLILDRNGKILADNKPSYQLEITPERVPDMQDTLNRLVAANILAAGDLAELRELLASRRSFETLVIAEHLSNEELAAFAVRRPQFPGLEMRARLGRNYPHGAAAAHVLGYVGSMSAADKREFDPADYAGTTHVGKSAAERSFEHDLHGTSGHEDVVVNAHGRKMRVLNRVRPLPGRDVILTIDLDAQLAASNALAGRRGAEIGRAHV